jgi:leucyl-tRNA synthetase
MYDFQKIEQKWQQSWDKAGISSFSQDDIKPKFYVLEMFPYPSGKLHMGHVRNYTLGDVLARYKKMQGFNVLHPMGYDAFGLPAENAAIEHNTLPQVWTYQNIQAMNKSFAQMGFMYDFSNQVVTCSPDYYKHEQEIFISFLERGLAYKKESYVNWDPVDNTVLANEQVVNGRGWRSGALVEKKLLSQWFLKITQFADDLLDSLDSLVGWPDAVKAIQRKWIGRSEGAQVSFQVVSSEEVIEVFTTRVDTLYGASFVAISPAHPLAIKLAEKNNKIADFLKEVNQIGTSEEEIETAEKKGIDTKLSVTVPITGAEVPLYIANFVLMEYGTGAVFGCPGHDPRDFEFAKKYNLPIIQVVESADHDYTKAAYSGPGHIINSDFLTGLDQSSAKKEMIYRLKAIKAGRACKTYRIRDWGVSRQRYWGCPIPIIYCDECGAVPVPRDNLPVTLPEDVDFSKSGNPLFNHPTWKNTNCPKCSKPAIRETDTFDTFFESSWYFLRYCSPSASNAFDRGAVEKLLPVDQYIGGIEHAAMHLLYARFFTKALTSCGYINLNEPFKGLLTQGMVLHVTYKDQQGKWVFPEDAVGRDDVVTGRVEKMSKSKKNLVEPVAIINKYGADTARFFIMSDSPPERDLEWSESGVEGSFRFLTRVHKYVEDFVAKVENFDGDGIDGNFDREIHKLLNQATINLENLLFNSVIARIREIANLILATTVSHANYKSVSSGVEILIKVISPFTPHLSEELWHMIGRNELLISQSWPKVEERFLINDKVTLAVQVNGKLRDTITIEKDLTSEQIEAKVMLLQKLQPFIVDKEIRKMIIIPNKVVNVVV